MIFGSETMRTVETQIRKDLQQGLRDQGHYLTGDLERSLNNEPRIEQEGDTLDIDVEALDYIETLETGVPAENINLAQDAAIMAEYAKLRFGYQGRKALRVGFAIAQRHKEEGNPTHASYRFSKTGDRKHVIEQSFDDPLYDKLFESGMDDEFESLINDTFGEIKF